jgi:penicillin-binding protein 1A
MKLLKFFLQWGFFFLIWIAILSILALFYYFKDLPDLDELKTRNGRQTVEIDYANGERITNRGEIYTIQVDYYELPPELINAVIATEDRRFFKHHGIDFIGILRAFYVNHEAGKIVQGGSTITQQLAKLVFLKPQKTIKRKIQEILLALQLENDFTKEQILTFYLNLAYFGSGNYGVGNAAKYYFGKNVSDLNLNEAALIAGLLKAPSKLSPRNNRELAQNRANIVLKNMIDAGFLDEKNLKQLDLDPSYKTDHLQKLYFTDFVYDQFLELFAKKAIPEEQLRITTTLDKKVQEKLENVLDEFAAKNAAKIGKSQIAVVIMNKNGAVLGMSGGKDYQQSQFNRAVYAKRQPGSAFKTFIYLAAFEKGFQPDDIMEDKKINFGAWLPENYNGHYLGKVTLKEAFARSLNSVAVQLGKEVGGRDIAALARQCGIAAKIDENDPTIALGTTEVTLLEITGAYATIANGGIPVLAYVISAIKNADDQLLYKRSSSGFKAVITSQAQKNIKEILRAVVKEGTGQNANVAPNIYGKTGTSQNFRDAWFVGFNDKYILGIWIGNDDNSATGNISGGSLPADLFGKILQKI